MSAEISIPLGEWPDEILQHIFAFLRLKDILRCERVCRRWKTLIRHPLVWRNVRVYCDNYDNEERKKKKMLFFLSHGRYVRKLQLYGITRLSDIKCILEKCKDLISLELLDCVLDKELENDIVKYKNLRVLYFTYFNPCWIKSYPTIQYDQLLCLRKLKLWHSELLNETNRESLLRCSLRHINLLRMGNLDAQYVARLLGSQRATLVHFWIDGGAWFDERCVRQLALCSRLEFFNAEAVPARHVALIRDLFSGFEVAVDSDNVLIPKGCCTVTITHGRHIVSGK